MGEKSGWRVKRGKGPPLFLRYRLPLPRRFRNTPAKIANANQRARNCGVVRIIRDLFGRIKLNSPQSWLPIELKRRSVQSQVEILVFPLDKISVASVVNLSFPLIRPT